jgi:predicted dehydrogenase
MYRFNLASFLIVGLLLAAVARAADLRLGMVGLDTGHVIAFTKVLNNPNDKDHVPGARVVAAVKGGSPDIASSWSRVDGYTKQLQEEFGVKLYPSITEMAKHVDVILIESVDGRPHLVQAREAILAGKPTYVEKPAAASLKDAMEIYAFAKQRKVPVFSSSALRFAAETQAVRNGSIGRVRSAETGSPASLEPTHMDLFWYGVHGVESLFTVMGTGLESVTRRNSEAGSIVTEGKWAGGRTGTYRQQKGYSGKAVGEKGEAPVGKFDGYVPLVKAIVKFGQTGVPPVSAEETLEIIAFMEADFVSKQRGGATVTVAEVRQAAAAGRVAK